MDEITISSIKKYKYQILFFSIAVVLFFVFCIFGYFSYYREYKKYSINGRIDSFYLDQKGHPHVKVKENSYYFFYNWNQKIKLEEGDSIYKSAGEYNLNVFDKRGKLTSVRAHNRVPR